MIHPTTEDMPTGQTPHTMVIFAHGDLVDKVQPGDRITVTGWCFIVITILVSNSYVYLYF